MNELNKEKILYALRCICGEFVKCSDCAFFNESRIFPQCREYAGKSALSLINELTEENERLRAIPEELYKEMSERNVEERKIERKLAVRKIQDAVAVHFGTYTDTDTVKVLDVFKLLGKIAEEMLEGGTDG